MGGLSVCLSQATSVLPSNAIQWEQIFRAKQECQGSEFHTAWVCLRPNSSCGLKAFSWRSEASPGKPYCCRSIGCSCACLVTSLVILLPPPLAVTSTADYSEGNVCRSFSPCSSRSACVLPQAAEHLGTNLCAVAAETKHTLPPATPAAGTTAVGRTQEQGR